MSRLPSTPIVYAWLALASATLLGQDRSSDAFSDAELQGKAVETLMSVLHRAPSLEQIHAAEVLAGFGYADEVHAHLAAAGASDHASPIYRVLRWRALAGTACSQAERREYVRKILDIAADPEMPDRLHAAESAAKLGAAPPPEIVPVLLSWAATAPERDAVFVRWCLWAVRPPADPAGQMEKWLQSEDPIARLRAAYALRWLEGAIPTALETLAEAAELRTDPEVTSAIVLASACILLPSHPSLASWRSRLVDMIASAPPAVVYHAVQGWLVISGREDLPWLIPLLDHADADVRTAAAWVVLAITTRGMD